MPTPTRRTTAEKIALFKKYFTGLPHVYGTYDPVTKKAYQVKAPVTDAVILAHLQGKQPYGVYLLNHDRTRALAVDFDTDNPLLSCEFLKATQHYRLPAYIERSKSKGYHVWFFFAEPGVLAAGARQVVRHLLEEIDHPETEIFPKHDSLNTDIHFGNYINAPYFGALVPQGRTVFVDPDKNMNPYPDPWEFLESIQYVPESLIEEIIAVNDLQPDNQHHPNNNQNSFHSTPGLPHCAQKILQTGVTANQRVICFRLAVHLKRIGFPADLALAVLKEWAQKNRPADGKQIITTSEIAAQTECAYQKDYRSCGCEEPIIQPYCDPQCPIYQKKTEPIHSAKTNTGGN